MVMTSLRSVLRSVTSTTVGVLVRGVVSGLSHFENKSDRKNGTKRCGLWHSFTFYFGGGSIA